MNFYHSCNVLQRPAVRSSRMVLRNADASSSKPLIDKVVMPLCLISLFALGILSVLSPLIPQGGGVNSFSVHSSPFLFSSMSILKFAQAAKAVCSSATYTTPTYTIGAADTYTWTSCRFDVFGVITAASMTATSGTTAITVSGGTVAASTAKGIRIIAPTTAIAAARGPLAITVSSVTFESNTILRFDGTLPRSSTVSFTGNKFTLTALNTLSTYTNVIYAICVGASTADDTFVLQDSAAISIKSNTITGSIVSAGTEIFTTAVFFRGSPVTVTGSASLSITSNTASFVGSYYGNLVQIESRGTFTITSSGALTISSNTLRSYTATQTALLVQFTCPDNAVFTNNGRFTVSSNTMTNVGAGSRVGFLEFRTDNTLQMASGGGMVLDSNTLTGSDNPGGSTVLYFIINAFGYMKTNSVFYVRSNKASMVKAAANIYLLIFRAEDATAPYEISGGSFMQINNNKFDFTKSATLIMNSFEANSFIMSSLTSWVNITNNAVTSCTVTSGELSIFRSIDTANTFTVTGFALVGNSIVTTTVGPSAFLLRLHAAGISLVSGGAMVIESNTVDRLNPSSSFFIAYIPATSTAFSFALSSKSLFSFSNNVYKGIRFTSTMQMLYLTSASFTATSARVVMNGNAITNTTARAITALTFGAAVNGAPFTLTSSTFEASWNTASSVTATGTFVFCYNSFGAFSFTSSTYTTDGNTFTSVTAPGLQVTRLSPTSLLMTSGSTLSASSNVITGSTSTDAFYGVFLYCAASLRLESKSAITMNNNQFASMTSSRVGIVAYIYVHATAGIVMVGASTLTMENNRATSSPAATGTLRAASIVANVLSMTSSTLNVNSNRVVSPGTGGAKSAAQMTFAGGITLSGSQLIASTNYIDSASPAEAQVVMFETDGTMSLTTSSTVTLNNNYASNVALFSTVGHVVSVYCGLLTMQTSSNLMVAGNSLKSTAITGSSPRWFVVRFRGVSGASTMSASGIAIDNNVFTSVTRVGSSQASLVHFSVVSLSMASASTIVMTKGNVPQMSITSPLVTIVTTTASSNGLQLSGGSSITIATNTLYAAVAATLAALIQLDVDPLIAGTSSISVVSNTLDATATTTSYSFSGIEFTRAVSLTASGAALNANSNTIRLASASSCPPHAIETSTVTQTASTGGTLSMSGNTVTLTSIGTAATIAASACPAFYLADVASVSTSSFVSNVFSANTAARIYLLKQTVPTAGLATYSSNTVTQTGASGLKLPTVASVVAIVTVVINGNGAMTLNSNTVTAPSAKYVTSPHYVLDNTAFTFSASSSVTACGNRFYNMLRERPAHLYTPRMAMRAGDEVKLCPAFQGRTQSATLTLSVSATKSVTVSSSASASQSATPSKSLRITASRTILATPSKTLRVTASVSLWMTRTMSVTESRSLSKTISTPATYTVSLTTTLTPTDSFTRTRSHLDTATASVSPTPTTALSVTPSATLRILATRTLGPTETSIASGTATASEPPKPSVSAASTMSDTPSATLRILATRTLGPTETSIASGTLIFHNASESSRTVTIQVPGPNCVDGPHAQNGLALSSLPWLMDPLPSVPDTAIRAGAALTFHLSLPGGSIDALPPLFTTAMGDVFCMTQHVSLVSIGGNSKGFARERPAIVTLTATAELGSSDVNVTFVLTLSALPAYAIVESEALEILVPTQLVLPCPQAPNSGGGEQRGAFVSIGRLVVAPTAIDPILADANDAATAVSGAVTIVAAVGGFGASTAEQQALSALAMMSCADPNTRQAFGSYRALSPFALWDSYIGVVAGNFVFLAAVFCLQFVVLLSLRFLQRVRRWEELSALIYFPAILLNCSFSVHTGTAYAASQLITLPDRPVEDRVVGALAFVFAILYPLWLVGFAYWFIGRAYQSYAVGEYALERGWPAWVTRVLPHGAIYAPETRRTFGAYISSYRLPHHVWPSYPTWTALIFAIGGLFHPSTVPECQALFAVMGVAFLACCCVVLYFRPRRADPSNWLDGVAQLISAITLFLMMVANTAGDGGAGAATAILYVGFVQTAVTILRMLYLLSLFYFDRLLEPLAATQKWVHYTSDGAKTAKRFGAIGEYADELFGEASKRELEELELPEIPLLPPPIKESLSSDSDSGDEDLLGSTFGSSSSNSDFVQSSSAAQSSSAIDFSSSAHSASDYSVSSASYDSASSASDDYDFL